jgi:hypothetical protein
LFFQENVRMSRLIIAGALLVAALVAADSHAQIAGDPAGGDSMPGASSVGSTEGGAVEPSEDAQSGSTVEMFVEGAPNGESLENVDGESVDESSEDSGSPTRSEDAGTASAAGGAADAESASSVASPEEAGSDAAAGPATGEPAAAPDEVVLFIRRDADRQAFLLDALRSEISGAQKNQTAKASPKVRYSITESFSAAVSYDHAFLFDTASDEELRRSRVGAFSTARERDVFGLGMDWGVSEKSRVGIGYQLQSIRPDGSTGQSGSVTSILPGSEDVNHAFTLGVTRSWGGGDDE